MDNKFEYDVPYVEYQMFFVGKEYWEVKTPADLILNDLEICKCKITNQINITEYGVIEVLVEKSNGYDMWERIELIAMAHILNVRIFETEEEAKKYAKFYLNKKLEALDIKIKEKDNNYDKQYRLERYRERLFREMTKGKYVSIMKG